MFNLEDILNYLRARPLPTIYDFSADHSATLHRDRWSLFIMLFLVGITTMMIFSIAALWELGEQLEQRLRNGDLFAAFENDLMDLGSGVLSVPRPGIEGRMLPGTHPPALDENDNFMLPPPAYQLFDDFEGGHLPWMDPPALDENDNSMLPPPAFQLDEDVDGGDPDEMRTAGVPDFVTPTHVDESPYEWFYV